MKYFKILLLASLVSLQYSCQTKEKNKQSRPSLEKKKEIKTETKSKTVFLNDDNAIPFFYEYEKHNKENKVRIITRYGNIDILLYENTPYHRANFVYLTKMNYFESSIFHRVVSGFIIQGGNSDSRKSALKRTKIGRYLLPPDTEKGHPHHRGVISMPSSEIDNPHKMASPYEFFIVQQSPGAYHLDGSYTAFGEVINGMDVVDKINKEPVDSSEMPHNNVYLKTIIIK